MGLLCTCVSASAAVRDCHTVNVPWTEVFTRGVDVLLKIDGPPPPRRPSGVGGSSEALRKKPWMVPHPLLERQMLLFVLRGQLSFLLMHLLLVKYWTVDLRRPKR